jgi:hypothetical protein
MKKYKLTTQDFKTHNGFQWKIGVEVVVDGKGELCSSHFLHYYHSPLLAILLNPIHVNIANPKLFEIKALGKHLDDKGLKGGCTKMTLIKEISIPIISLDQRIIFGILCALEVYKEENFVLWANNWLKNKDRSKIATANVVANVAYAANAAADFNLIRLSKKALKYK